MSAKVIPERQIPNGVPNTPMASPALTSIKKKFGSGKNGANAEPGGEDTANSSSPSGESSKTPVAMFFSRATRLPGLQKRNFDPPSPSPRLSGTQKQPSDVGRIGSDTSMKRRESTASIEIVDSTMNDETHIHTQDRTVNFSRDLFALGSGGKRRKSMSDKNAKEEEEEESGGNLATLTLVLLFIVGIFAGLVNGLAIWAARIIGQYQAQVINLTARWDFGMLYFTCTTVILASLAAYLCTLSSHAVFGSGMPEMKALLASDFSNAEYPKIVSWRIMFIRLSSLILALGSGLSVGSAGPLVHIAACVAYILMKFVPEFGDIFDSPSQTKQIFAASAAVGLTAVFNAPVGGLLFSVEVTSTFYLISNYWKSFMAATASAVMFNMVLLAQGEGTEIRVFTLAANSRPFLKWEFCLYIILGVMLGYIAKYYLRLHQAWWRFARKYTSKYPVGTAALVGLITAVLLYSTGSYTDTNVSVGAAVLDALTTGTVSSMRKYTSLPQLLGLPIMFFVRMFLTMIATNLRIPAGLFTPMFLLGAQFGRFFGVVLQELVGSRVDIYITGYAMVGAVAFVSGITHTISAAVIAVELTGQLEMLLPCLIGAVVASGITKNQGLSLYDQGMVNKGLESFQLLIMGAGGYRYANDIVDRSVTKLMRVSTIRDIFAALDSNQYVFPVINNADSSRLIGSLTRHDAFYFLKKTFGDENLGWYVREQLPLDTKDDDEKIARVKAKANYRWLRSIKSSVSVDPAEAEGGGADEELEKNMLTRTIGYAKSLLGYKPKNVDAPDSPVSSAKKKTALELLANTPMCNKDVNRRRQYYSQEGANDASGTAGGDIESQTHTVTQFAESNAEVDPDAEQKAKEAAAAAMLLNAFVKRRTAMMAETSSKKRELGSIDSDPDPCTPTSTSEGHLINLSGNVNRTFSSDDFTSANSQFAGRRLEESPSPRVRKSLLPPLRNPGEMSPQRDGGWSASSLGQASNESMNDGSINEERSWGDSAAAGGGKISSSSSKTPPPAARSSFTAAGLDVVTEHGEEDDLSDCPDHHTEKSGAGSHVEVTKPLSLDSKTLNSLKMRRLSNEDSKLASPVNVLVPGHRRSIVRSKQSNHSADAPSSAAAAVAGSAGSEASDIDSSGVASDAPAEGASAAMASTPHDAHRARPNKDEHNEGESKSDEEKKIFSKDLNAEHPKSLNSDTMLPAGSLAAVSPAPEQSKVSDTATEGADIPSSSKAAVANAAAAFLRKSNPSAAAKLQRLARSSSSDSDVGKSAGMIARLAKVAQNVMSLSPKVQRSKSGGSEQQMKEKIERLLSSPVDVVNEPLLPINAFPFTAHERTPMEHIYVLFEMVKVTCVFIIDNNKKLTGMISKEHLLNTLKNKNA